MALPVAGSSWKLLKYVLRASEFAIPAGYAYLEDMLDHSDSASGLEWMRWVCVFNKATPAGTTEDKAQFKFDLLNITSGSVDTTWTAGDFATVAAAFDAFFTSTKVHLSSNFTLSEYRAYQMAFNPGDPGPGQRSRANGWAFAPTGPPRYVATKAVPMTGGGVLPHQVAMTCTLRTPWARHWGRIYLPPPAFAEVTSDGRIGTAARTPVANAALALGTTLSNADFLPVVPSTDLNKTAFHALIGVTQYVVDDVLDVQRRRRANQPAARSIGV